mmetsp:Transcript_116413/g.370349  ORF Transcript_116413/g.370349 Transcript_116413/m.370349 type:complete len:178 (-) Transcript_116413:444-977(-)
MGRLIGGAGIQGLGAFQQCLCMLACRRAFTTCPYCVRIIRKIGDAGLSAIASVASSVKPFASERLLHWRQCVIARLREVEVLRSGRQACDCQIGMSPHRVGNHSSRQRELDAVRGRRVIGSRWRHLLTCVIRARSVKQGEDDSAGLCSEETVQVYFSTSSASPTCAHWYSLSAVNEG